MLTIEHLLHFRNGYQRWLTYKNVYVRELREGGAVHKDGLQTAVCQVLSLPSTTVYMLIITRLI